MFAVCIALFLHKLLFTYLFIDFIPKQLMVCRKSHEIKHIVTF